MGFFAAITDGSCYQRPGSVPLCATAVSSAEDPRTAEYRARRLALLCLQALDRHRTELAPALAPRLHAPPAADAEIVAGSLAQALMWLTSGCLSSTIKPSPAVVSTHIYVMATASRWLQCTAESTPVTSRSCTCFLATWVTACVEQVFLSSRF